MMPGALRASSIFRAHCSIVKKDGSDCLGTSWSIVHLLAMAELCPPSQPPQHGQPARCPVSQGGVRELCPDRAARGGCHIESTPIRWACACPQERDSSRCARSQDR